MKELCMNTVVNIIHSVFTKLLIEECDAETQSEMERRKSYCKRIPFYERSPYPERKAFKS